MKMKADIEMKKLESDKRVMELIRLGKTQGGFVALSQIEEKFPGHIACDSASRSEIVIPIHDKKGAVAAVIDIDSPYQARFDEADQRGLELCANVLETYLRF